MASETATTSSTSSISSYCESCDTEHKGDPCPMQRDRIKLAKDTLEYFAKSSMGEWIDGQKSMSADLVEQNMSDLICNFAHYCDGKKVSLGEVLRRAQSHYREESSDPRQEFEPSYGGDEAVAGQTVDPPLPAREEYRCQACNREESVCSNDPCEAVVADREAKG